MSDKAMDSGKEAKKRDPDLAAAEIAMKRAAAKARQKAKQVGAGVVVWKNGRIVEERQSLQVGE
jgi:LDH2 family malate/lactate/ureidoglycolate dehydrogenase